MAETTVPNLAFTNIATPDAPKIRVASDSLKGSGAVTFDNAILMTEGGAAPTLEMLLTFKNTEGKYMLASVPAAGFTSSTVVAGMLRGIELSGIDLDTENADLDIDLLEGSEVVGAIPAQLFQLAFDALRQQIGSSAKWDKRPTFMDTGIIADRVFADATARDAAITSPTNGDRCYNTATGTFQKYQAGAWANDATGTTVNATETVAGKSELATQAENDAGTATGGTGAALSGTPTRNAASVQNSVWSYAADAEASDTYVITLTPAPTAYAAGQDFTFKANTANTGAATLNVNALGAKNILKFNDQTLEDGDIEAGSMVHVKYDGTSLQLQTPVATNMTSAQADTLTAGVSSDADALHTHPTIGANDAGFNTETDVDNGTTNTIDTTIVVGFEPSVIEIEYRIVGRQAAQKYTAAKAIFDGTTGKYQITWFTNGTTSQAMTTASPVTGFTNSTVGASDGDNCLTTFTGVFSTSATGFVLRATFNHGAGSNSTGEVHYGWKCWK